MSRVAFFVGALAMLLALSVSSAHAQCSFSAYGVFSYWAGPPSGVSSCFQTIPLNDTRRNATMNVVRTVFNSYSFADLVQAPAGDYYNPVRHSALLSLLFSPVTF